VPGIRVALYHLFPGYEGHLNTAFETVCDALATGCLLAILLPTLRQRRWFTAIISSRAFPLLLLAVWIVNKQTDHPHFLWLLGIPFMNVIIALTIARYVVFPGTPGGRLLNTTPLVSIGVWSYSLYLWQQLFLTQWRPPTSIVQVFPLNVVLACTCGILSYALVEKPFLQLRDRVRSARARSSANAGPPESGPGLAPALAIVKPE
jgi:peptidoglycan/LPS O-acetylase OafA/YrhL